jgi:hypothetical protein
MVAKSKIIARSKAGERFWSSARGGDVSLCYLCGCAIARHTDYNFPRSFDGSFKECHSACYNEMIMEGETVDEFRVRMEENYPQGRY